MDAAMSAAVSALQAQSSALSTVSNNLANSQTSGYKAVKTQFDSLLTEGAVGISYPAGGVQAVARQNLLAQGNVTSTTTSTDMAINGNGMFPVTYGVGGVNTYYTRDGAFDSDASGNLVLSGTNYALVGWATDTKGNILGANADNTASLVPVNINKYNSSAVATTEYTMQANLPAEAQSDVTPIPYTTTSTVTGLSSTVNATMGYAQVGTTAATATADGTATYLLTINAAPGQTIGDSGSAGGTTTFANGTAQGSQLVYQVTVDTSGTNDGTIIGITGVTPGATNGFSEPVPSPLPLASGGAATAVDFPTLVDGNGSTVTLPTTWTATTPTWSQVSTTVATTFSKQLSMAVYDSLGVQQTFPVTWTAAGSNNWIMTVGTPTDPSGKTVTGSLEDSAGNSVTSYSYNIAFNSDGSLGTISALTDSAGGTAPTSSAGAPLLSAVWNDGAAANTVAAGTAIAVNLGTNGETNGLSQFDTGESTPSISVKSTTQNGVQYGQLTGVSVNSAGEVIAAYDNGQKVPIFKVPVVTFPNENGLTAENDGVFQQSSLSGTYTLNQAGTNGAGTITGEALEASTVDTSTEFSNMIVAQQAYSSASQVIGVDKQDFTSLIQVVQ